MITANIAGSSQNYPRPRQESCSDSQIADLEELERNQIEQIEQIEVGIFLFDHLKLRSLDICPE